MTRASYLACGKQVLRDGVDFAQAASPEAAILIVLAMDGAEATRVRREGLAMLLRSQAVTVSNIAAQLSGLAREQLCPIFNAMNEAARELSNGH
jgi:hypothetical protein